MRVLSDHVPYAGLPCPKRVHLPPYKGHGRVLLQGFSSNVVSSTMLKKTCRSFSELFGVLAADILLAGNLVLVHVLTNI